MKVAILALIFASAFVAADLWSSCGDSSDVLKIGKIIVSPNPPVAGKPITVEGAGLFRSDVTSGTIYAEVSVDDLPLINLTLPLCSTVKKFRPCPFLKGQQSLKLAVPIPSAVPSGEYVAKVQVFDQNNARVTCVTGKKRIFLVEAEVWINDEHLIFEVSVLMSAKEKLKMWGGSEELPPREIPLKRPYMARFRSQHAEFRIPELRSLAQMFGFLEHLDYGTEQAKLVSQRREELPTSPYLPIACPSQKQIEQVASRSVSLMSFFDLIAVGDTFEELLENISHYPQDKLQALAGNGRTFKYHVDSYGRKMPHAEQLVLMERLTNINGAWESGNIDLKNPQETWTIFVDYGVAKNRPMDDPRRYYLGRKICNTPVDLIEVYNVKKRNYIGTTSMDSELSLMMANQALARSGTIAMDPFAGTGSLLLTCAHFGSMVMGSDIDQRMFRGWGEGKDLKSNFKQYGIENKYIDVIVADNSHTPYRTVPFIDALVADPPYGIRAGARKIGKKRKTILREQKLGITNAHRRSNHIIQCINYAVSDVLHDLLNLAATRLVVGGRLVYWLPTTDQYKDSDLPLHPCLRIISNSEQPLTMRWRRRLITMEKFTEYIPSVHDNLSPEEYGQINLSDDSHGNLKNYWLRIGSNGGPPKEKKGKRKGKGETEGETAEEETAEGEGEEDEEEVAEVEGVEQ
ncbi:tRNA guanosine-2'-O-methyltransferase 11 [Planoprotostelium fungivorum]|uniref:tRNA (guanine(10)-N(2))-methyltransferase n=1 Tax=Planoprotostelium fungivorum TaxID=1890364 RepID=A0A2P6NVP0_9EUKA|nr:tRNA guanosine-2'-O-methyltransferase 11 [Planoprotostelium fungivorum]